MAHNLVILLARKELPSLRELLGGAHLIVIATDTITSTSLLLGLFAFLRECPLEWSFPIASPFRVHLPRI